MTSCLFFYIFNQDRKSQMNSSTVPLEDIFPACHQLIARKALFRLVRELDGVEQWASLPGAYDSPAGQRYRGGSAACRGCKLLPSCGGCQAVIYSLGLDPSQDRDPYCFYAQAPRQSG